MLALDTPILDFSMQRLGYVGLWLEPEKFAPFSHSIRLDAQPTKILGAAPYGEESLLHDYIELIVDGRERFPLVATGDTRLYVPDMEMWVPISLLKPGDLIIVPKPEAKIPSVSALRIRAMRGCARPDGLEQARSVRWGTLRVDPKGEFCTPSGFIKTQLDRCAPEVRP